MRREALLATLVLLAALWAPPTAANPSACSDGVDNDGDGTADWPNDPGCTDANDPDEGGTTLCNGMLPPGPLTATWTPSGLYLDWEAPALGEQPAYYNVHRMTVTEEEAGQIQVAVSAKHPPQPAGTPQVRPAMYAINLQIADRMDLPLRLVASSSPSMVEPPVSVPATQTDYVDATAQRNGLYVYWVQGMGPACQGATSNLAFAFFGFTFPSSTFPPHWEDCFYYEPPTNHTQPSTRCLEATP